ncbi:hypothetical protein N826_40890 [Skermanella aerolata KACC 11604]|nr:hypothetical protein N826_40890 [Skermanella aerolata KACC 11604]
MRGGIQRLRETLVLLCIGKEYPLIEDRILGGTTRRFQHEFRPCLSRYLRRPVDQVAMTATNAHVYVHGAFFRSIASDHRNFS